MEQKNVFGLTNEEAKNLTLKNGLNVVVSKKKVNPVIKFLKYFSNPLIIILLSAVTICVFVGEIKNAIIIFSMAILSIVLDFYQEHKSSLAVEKIASRLALTSKVLRDNKEQKILSKYITVGDVVLLSAGDIIPADGKIFKADDFFVNESVMTGESFPVEKKVNIDDANMVYSDTNVVSGFCQYQVTAIGLQTKYGEMALRLETEKKLTAFELGIRQFGFLIIKIILLIVVLVFVINIFNQKKLFDSLLFSIAIAVGVTPELLPMIMSINMARGSVRMSKKGVLVKRLDAIPDFGSMDVLCTDKTGTLTQDKITLVKFVDTNGCEDESVLRYAYINSNFETGIKNILDQAIISFKSFDLTGIQKIDEAPYDFNRRRSSVVFKDKEGLTLVCKGAPEEMVKVCSSYVVNNQIEVLNDKISILNVCDDFGRQGYRVLAIAYKPVQEKVQGDFTKDDENNLILMGFVSFYDPPKFDVQETIKLMNAHGVTIKILTGDSLLVTKKICEDLALPVSGMVCGEDFDFDELNDEQLTRLALDNTIFARFTPIQKQRIIEILKKSGLVVGYLGDGINDALSLKMADVGISVENAVDVAKESADIILLQKGLSQLMEGVIEGRRTFGNTMKYLMMTLSSNFGNMFSMIAASMFLPFFPMLPSQILLNNFLYDTSQTTIPSDNVDQEYLKKPKHWDIGFIKKYMVVFGSVSSIFDLLTFFILYKMFSNNPSLFQTGWFLESFATQVFVIFIIRTRQIPFLESRPSKYLVYSIIGMFSLSFLATLPPFNNYFGFSLLPFRALIILALVVVIYLIVVEIVKQKFYSHYYKNSKI